MVPDVEGVISMRASIRTPLWAQVPLIPWLLDNNESSGTTVVRVGGKTSEWILKWRNRLLGRVEDTQRSGLAAW